jgi:hypothetical protein
MTFETGGATEIIVTKTTDTAVRAAFDLLMISEEGFGLQDIDRCAQVIGDVFGTNDRLFLVSSVVRAMALMNTIQYDARVYDEAQSGENRLASLMVGAAAAPITYIDNMGREVCAFDVTTLLGPASRAHEAIYSRLMKAVVN